MTRVAFCVVVTLGAVGCGKAVEPQKQPLEYRLPQLSGKIVQLPAAPMPTFTTAINSVREATPEAAVGVQAQVVAVDPPLPLDGRPLATYEALMREVELDSLLTEAGWPQELHEQAKAVIWCESQGRPDALGDSGRSVGLFQLNTMWFSYAGEAPERWADPLVNARVAWATYRYDLSRGQAPWQQWSCKP